MNIGLFGKLDKFSVPSAELQYSLSDEDVYHMLRQTSWGWQTYKKLWQHPQQIKGCRTPSSPKKKNKTQDAGVLVSDCAKNGQPINIIPMCKVRSLFFIQYGYVSICFRDSIWMCITICFNMILSFFQDEPSRSTAQAPRLSTAQRIVRTCRSWTIGLS